MLGLFRHVCATAHGYLRRFLSVERVRAPCVRLVALPGLLRGNASRSAPLPAQTAPRAGTPSRVLHFRRAACPGVLPGVYLCQQCGHGNRVRAMRPHPHYAHNLRKSSPRPDAPRAFGRRFGHRRHNLHRDEGKPRHARHSRRGAHVGRGICVRARLLHDDAGAPA